MCKSRTGGPWKIANGAENLVLQALQFHLMGICRVVAYASATEGCLQVVA
jgi:hypothetical protein